MQKLARQNWASGIAFRAYGVSIGIRTNLPELPGELVTLLPQGARRLRDDAFVDRLYSLRYQENQPGSRVKRFHLALSNATLIARSLEFDGVIRELESDVQRYLAEFSRCEIFVHAGVVGWKGKAILIPGPSSSGKSTLTAHLVRAGATYYSDEFAVLDARGRVKPFPRPLSLRQDGGTVVLRISAADLGADIGKRAIPVAAVWLTKFTPGAEWRPRRISASKGLLGLLANTVQARTRPAFVLKTLQRMAARTSFLKGPRGEAKIVVERLPATLLTGSTSSAR